MIQLQNISKSYEGRRVLQGIDLEIPSGQTRALVGASGCGKSTLLRVIMGLIPPDAGTVSIEGERLTAGGRAPAPPLDGLRDPGRRALPPSDGRGERDFAGPAPGLGTRAQPANGWTSWRASSSSRRTGCGGFRRS